MLAFHKPAGLPVSAELASPDQPNLISLVHESIETKKPWTIARNLTYLTNLFKLDTECSGVLLLAKSKPAQSALANQFGSDKPGLEFVALVQGEPAEESFAVDAKLAAHPTNPAWTRIDPQAGKKSRTQFEVIERFRGWSLLRCVPATLRPQQIRAHLKHAHFPVCGDALHGGKPLWLSRLKRDYRLKEGRTERPLISTVALHAERLSFAHPSTAQDIVITAPWPKDLKVAVKYLRQYAATGAPSTE